MKKNVLIFFLPLFLIMLTGCSLRNQTKQVSSIGSSQKLKENKTDEFFDKKQICAKYIPQIKKEIADYNEKYDNALGNSTTILEEVFYSPKLDTCLKADYRKIKAPGGQFTYSFYIVDILTEKYMMKESYQEYSMYDSFKKVIENYKKIKTDKDEIKINENLDTSIEKEDIKNPDQLNNITEQIQYSIYRDECKKEIDEKYAIFDNLIQQTEGLTVEQSQNLAKKSGITDQNNYVIDKDVLIKECIDKKISIYK